MLYNEMSRDELVSLKNELEKEYKEIKALGLSLDMSRGKPGADQLDLSVDMLSVMTTAEDCVGANGFDCRNYGVLDGIPECKKLFAELLDVDTKNIIIGDSRTVGMCASITGDRTNCQFNNGGPFVNGDDIYIAQGSIGRRDV